MAQIKVGQERKGFYFKGGDPSKKENWVKSPAIGDIRKGYEYSGGAPWKKESWKKIEENRPFYDVSLEGLAESVEQQAPLIGAIGGGLLGSIGGPIGAVGGAATGGYLGEAAQNVIRQMRGKPVTREEIYTEPLKGAYEGAVGEVMGAGIGKVATKGLKTAGGLLAKTAGAASKTSNKAMETYFKRAKKVDELIDQYENINDAPAEFKEQLLNQLRDVRRQASAAMGVALKSPKYSQRVKIKTAPLRKILLEKQSQINKVTRPAEYAQIEDMISRLDELAPDGKMSVSALHDFKEMAFDVAKGSFQKSGEITRSGKYSQSVAREIGGKANRLIRNFAPELKEANKKLAKIHDFESKITKSVLDPGKSPSKLMTIAKGKAPEQAKAMGEVGELIGRPKLLQDLEDVYTATHYANPDVLSGSFTGRSLLAGTLGGAAGATVDDPYTGIVAGTAFGSPAVQKQVIRGLSRSRGPAKLIAPTAGLLGGAAQRYFGQKAARGLLNE